MRGVVHGVRPGGRLGWRSLGGAWDKRSAGTPRPLLLTLGGLAQGENQFNLAMVGRRALDLPPVRGSGTHGGEQYGGAEELHHWLSLRAAINQFWKMKAKVSSLSLHDHVHAMPLHATLHSLSSDDDHQQFSQVSRRKCRRGRREFKKEAKETAAWSSGSCNAVTLIRVRLRVGSRHSGANLIRLSSGRERMGWDTTTVTRP